MESEEICATLQDLATKYNLPNYHIQHHYNTENVNEVDDADEVDEVTEDLPINNFLILQNCYTISYTRCPRITIALEDTSSKG